MNLNKLVDLLRKLRRFLWPVVVGLSTAVLFYFQALRYSRLKPPEPENAKTSNKKDELIVSVYANEMILRESDYSIIGENLKTFLSICSKTAAYVIVKIPNESVVDVVLSSIEACGAFKNGLLKHRVMFCQTPNGRISMVQQLQPHLHVELNSENVEFVSSKLIKQNVTTLENMELMLNDSADKPST